MSSPLPLDVLAIGRVGVDLYPEQIGRKLADVRTFRKMLGGSATNVAVAAARLGRRAGIVTKVGADGFGDYVRRAVAEFGVTGFIGTDPSLRTPVVFCEIFPPDHFPILFYREPTAPDVTLVPADIPFDELRSARLLWITGTGLSVEPSRETTLNSLAERNRSPTVFDLDFRPELWPSQTEARAVYRAALESATVVVGNTSEVAVAVDERKPADAARALLEFGAELAIVKRGPAGVVAATSSGTIDVPTMPVLVVNGLGAGDAFGGALCHALLGGWDLPRTIAFANAAGAIVAGRLGCADEMPTEAEIERALALGHANVGRESTMEPT